MAGEGALAMSLAPLAFECGCCRVTFHSTTMELPQGWAMIGGALRCDGCQPPADMVSPRADPAPLGAAQAAIGPTDPPSQFRGCRMGHDIRAGAITLCFRAGAVAPAQGRDIPVQFMLDDHELDQMIARLQLVQLERNSLHQQRSA